MKRRLKSPKTPQRNLMLNQSTRQLKTVMMIPKSLTSMMNCRKVDHNSRFEER